LTLFVIVMVLRFERLRSPSPSVQASLANAGLSVDLYAACMTAVMGLFGVVCFSVAAIIMWRRSMDGMAVSVSMLLLFLGSANSPLMQDLADRYPSLATPVNTWLSLLWASLILFLFLFPDGRFVPPWSGILAFGVSLGLPVSSMLTGDNLGHPSTTLVALLILGGLSSGAIAQIYRYFRVADFGQRQQTKCVVVGTVAASTCQVLFATIPAAIPSLDTAHPLYDLVDVTGVTLGYTLIPFSIGVAILRYRLWDIDVLISRALVYGTLTIAVIAIYTFVVGYLGTLFQTTDSLAISLLATGLVAVLFQPLRERVQRGINRLMWGERDDPYAVLSHLGRRLEGTLLPDAMLSTVVDTITSALRIPYAAITLRDDDHFAVAAARGTAVPSELTLPLTHNAETVGQLLVAPRVAGEPFSAADRRLLDDLARQAGIAAQSVRLGIELQRSRERLVLAREEERRRIRNDLHDGLGPVLSGLALRLETARTLVSDNEAADILLADMTARTQAAIGDIRRLVYDLRPPVLDELGLIPALREIGDQASGSPPHGLVLSVEIPERLPPLPAAIEVAIYRIVQEALSNVIRHARASSVRVRLSLAMGGAELDAAGDACRADCPVLTVEVSDDGEGFVAEARHGVGLASMRERAAELGGSLTIESAPMRGTRVTARFSVASSRP
jgi:signal transduction histidine kinase